MRKKIVEAKGGHNCQISDSKSNAFRVTVKQFVQAPTNNQ